MAGHFPSEKKMKKKIITKKIYKTTAFTNEFQLTLVV
jgi:hypothetical protein